MKTSFVIVRPKATGRSYLLSINFRELMTDCIETICGSLLGTSMPIVPLPGMGAMMRIPSAERFSAMSSSRLRILEMRTPCAGTTS